MPSILSLAVRLAVPMALACALAAQASDIERNAAPKTWTLTSGNETFRLISQGGVVAVDYFGPSAKAPAVATGFEEATQKELFGTAEGEPLSGSEMRLVSESTEPPSEGVKAIQLTMLHQRLPLQIVARYTAWGDTGVFTREVRVTNTGKAPIFVDSTLSIALELPLGDYTIRTLHGSWSEERQLATQALEGPGWSYDSIRGRSSNGFAPWMSLRNETSKTEYLAELAWSGNWNMQVARQPAEGVYKFNNRPSREETVRVKMGPHWDFGGALRLQPGESYDLPKAAFTASTGDFDDAANQMHRYQHQFVIPHIATNTPPLVQFNSWYPFPGHVKIDDMKALADVVSGLGAEIFVVDAGWYNHGDANKELGDYQVNRDAFPHGLEELSDYVASKGMKLGLWLEIESLGPESRMYKEHPDWCLAYNGAPAIQADRCQLNFAKPEVRAWATATVDRLVNSAKLSWIKIDYNLDVGDSFDPHGKDRPGNVFAEHVKHYYAWLDSVRAAHPDLVIENCASGGLRMDTGILSHTHTNWLSDNTDPVQSLQLGFGCTIQFTPEVCNHFMVGEDWQGFVALKKPEGWWDFMFRVPMNGQFGFSSHVLEWNEPLKRHAIENIALYKQIRSTLAGADVYHLTPEPAHLDPTGWMAIEYVSPTSRDGVVTAYRMKAGPERITLALRGLDEAATYGILRDGHFLGQARGSELARAGLQVSLDAEWRAAVFQLKRQ